MHNELRREFSPFGYVTVEVYTQVELCLNIVFTTVPSLQIFLASVHTGLLDLGVPTNDSAYGRGSRYRSTQRESHHHSSRSKGHHNRHDSEEDEIELTRQGVGLFSATITAGQEVGNRSVRSSSDLGIVVKQTVDLQYED
jgi:hypothetical protein